MPDKPATSWWWRAVERAGFLCFICGGRVELGADALVIQPESNTSHHIKTLCKSCGETYLRATGAPRPNSGGLKDFISFHFSRILATHPGKNPLRPPST